MFQKVKNFFLDLFFPKSCLGCRKTGVYICQSCLDKIEGGQIVSPRLTSPGLDTVQKIPSLDRLIWAVPYSNPLIKELIRIFKYHYIKELAEPLSKLLIKSLENAHYSLLISHYLVVPIPLHKKRLHERDFNQAELLAEEVANHFSLPLENILIRKKHTPSQARTKNHKERKKSLKNAFKISPGFAKKCIAENKNLLKDKIVLLIDDVATSGTTLSEAAKVLKQAGAKEIWGLVVAKG